MRDQQSTISFALCVENGGLEDLEARKLYQVLPDREARVHRRLWVEQLDIKYRECSVSREFDVAEFVK